MGTAAVAPASRVFVGRSRELDILLSGLGAVCAGRGTLCLVSGDAGQGKSRLLVEAGAIACQRGMAVHWGLAWESGGAPAYWPWIQVLRSVLATEDGRAAVRDVPHVQTALAQLVPELLPADRQRTGGALEPEQARFQLMDAVATLLIALSSRAALVVALEDLHVADPDSLALLEFVTRRLRTAKVMLLGSYRDGEIGSARLGSVIARIRREAIHVHLGALGRDAVREYIHAVTGERPLEQTVTELFRLTEGHPLYLAEVVALGVARGGFRMTPTSLTLAIRERVASLPAQTRSLLETASVIGRHFSLAALADLAELPVESVRERLEPALDVRLIEATGPDMLQFEHMLVREVFHDALPKSLRCDLHGRRAKRLEEWEGDEREKPWADLARHLEESGPEARQKAVYAWRRAAMQADTRHAFDEAALCYSRALDALGAGPEAASHTLASLLLELAAAQIRAGDLDAGRRNCKEAFAIGEALGDGALAADTALTYGSIFTYGDVDQTLVQLLKAAQARLADRDPGRAARVMARLAAAMQPASDPAEPIRLAREAIQLARSTGDARTLLVTLRSAISALMDVGDPVERLALNREHVALARSLGDLSECMRGSMRTVVDAMELGDAVTMDEAIGQCEGLANRLALPQYLWTAAAFRTMRATIRGEIAQARASLAQAEQLAERSQDPNAARTLAIQRLAIAELGGSRDEILALVAQVERLTMGLPSADAYLLPHLRFLRARFGAGEPKAMFLDEASFECVLRFRDPAGLCALGDHVALLREREMAERLYENLLPLGDRCGHWGLLGMRWEGPVARVLGLLAAVLGRRQEMEAHFAKGLEIARRMGAQPWLERIGRERAEAAGWLEKSASTAAAEPVRQARQEASIRGVPTVGYFRLQREGDVWLCECDGQQFRLRDTRGLQMLARLIANPNTELHVLDLVGGPADAPLDAGDSGELLDEKARREYRRRTRELREEIEEAEAHNDLSRAEAAREELEQLSSELARAFGLGGRARRAGSAVERARVNVQRRLKDAMQRISRECPAAGRHLEWAIRTGTFCSYRPG